MTKYHINGEGNPGLCKAQNGKCPFGGEANHYSSEENARKAFELSMASKANPPAKRKKLSSTEAIAEAHRRRNLKDFANVFSLINWGAETDPEAIKSMTPTYDKLKELAEGVAVGNMFERARNLEKAYENHMTGPLDEKLVAPSELDQDNYLQIVAPATAQVNFTMTNLLEKDDWTIRTKDSDFEQNARAFADLIKLDMKDKDSDAVALAKLRAAGWAIDDEDAYAYDIRNAILEGQRVAKTYGTQYKYEQMHLL